MNVGMWILRGEQVRCLPRSHSRITRLGGVGPFSLRIGTFLPQYVLLMYRLCIMDVLCWDTYLSMYLGVSKCIILYPLRNTCILVRYMCIVCIGNVSWMYYGLGPRYMSNTRAIHVYPAGQYVGYT